MNVITDKTKNTTSQATPQLFMQFLGMFPQSSNKKYIFLQYNYTCFGKRKLYNAGKTKASHKEFSNLREKVASRPLFDKEIRYDSIKLSYANRPLPILTESSSVDKTKTRTIKPFRSRLVLNESSKYKQESKAKLGVLLNHKLKFVKEKTKLEYLKKLTPKMKLSNFAFGSAFFVIALSSMLERQDHARWLVYFSRRTMPGLHTSNQESSWECFESIISKYVNRDTQPLLESVDVYKDQCFAHFSSNWDKQSQKCFTGFFEEKKALPEFIQKKTDKAELPDVLETKILETGDTNVDFARPKFTQKNEPDGNQNALTDLSVSFSLGSKLTLQKELEQENSVFATLSLIKQESDKHLNNSSPRSRLSKKEWMLSPSYWHKISATLPPKRRENSRPVHNVLQSSTIKDAQPEQNSNNSSIATMDMEPMQDTCLDKAFDMRGADLQTDPRSVLCQIKKSDVPAKQDKVSKTKYIYGNNLSKGQLFPLVKRVACLQNRVFLENNTLKPEVVWTEEGKLSSNAFALKEKKRLSTIFNGKKQKIEAENDSIPVKMDCSVKGKKKQLDLYKSSLYKKTFFYPENSLKNFFYEYGPVSAPSYFFRKPKKNEEGKESEEQKKSEKDEKKTKLVDIDKKPVDTGEEAVDTDEEAVDTDEEFVDTDEEFVDAYEEAVDTDEEAVDTDEEFVDTDEELVNALKTENLPSTPSEQNDTPFLSTSLSDITESSENRLGELDRAETFALPEADFENRLQQSSGLIKKALYSELKRLAAFSVKAKMQNTFLPKENDARDLSTNNLTKVVNVQSKALQEAAPSVLTVDRKKIEDLKPAQDIPQTETVFAASTFLQKEALEDKELRKLFPTCFIKRNYMRKRSMSGYRFPEFDKNKISQLSFLKKCGNFADVSSANSVYIKIPPALPFFESTIKTRLSKPFDKTKRVGDRRQLCSQISALLDEKSFVTIKDASDARTKKCASSEQVKAAHKLGRVAFDKTNKKMQYKQLKLEERNQVIALFEKLCATPNRNAFGGGKANFHSYSQDLPFKHTKLQEGEINSQNLKPLFKNYNDYLRWPKESLAAIKLSPSLEEDKTIEEEFVKIEEQRAFVKEMKKKEKAAYLASRISKKGEQESGEEESDQDQKEELQEEEEESDQDEEEEEDLTRFEYLNEIREEEEEFEQGKDLRKLAYPNKLAFCQNEKVSGGTKFLEQSWALKQTENASEPICLYRTFSGEGGERGGLLPLQETAKRSHLLDKQPFFVSDRKHSFFGIQNLFAKRLVAQDQEEINSQNQSLSTPLPYRPINQQRNNSSLITLGNNDSLPSSSLLLKNDKALEDSKKSQLDLGNEPGSGMTNIKKAHPCKNFAKTFLLYPAKLMPREVRQSISKETQSKALLQGLPDLVTDLFSDLDNKKLFKKDVRKEAISIGKVSHSLFDRLVATGDKPERDKIVFFEYPQHKPNPNVRGKQSELIEESFDPFHKDGLECQSHRWWQQRRIQSSALGAPSRRYLAMPKITEDDWRTIIGWQLKTYLLDEEKRVKPLVLSKPKHNFKIKKISVYLPWVTLKKPVQKPFEWPITRLDCKNSFELSQSEAFIRPQFGFANGELVSKATLSKTEASFDKCPSSLLQNLSLQTKGATLPTLRFGFLPTLGLEKQDLPLRQSVKQIKFRSFTWNWQGKSCFASPSLRHFYSFPSPQRCGKAIVSSRPLKSNTSTAQQGKEDLRQLVTRSNLVEEGVNNFDSQTGQIPKSLQDNIYKVLLFERVTSSSWGALDQLVLALSLKIFFEYLYHVSGKDLFKKLTSSLGIAELVKSLTKPYNFTEFYTLNKQLKDVVCSEDTIAACSELVWYLRNSCRGRMVPRGVVLVGQKNFDSPALLKAIGGEAQVPVIVQSLRALTLTQRHPQHRLEKVLELASKRAPCLLFLDDLDAIGQSRAASLTNTSKMHSKTAFLSLKDQPTKLGAYKIGNQRPWSRLSFFALRSESNKKKWGINQSTMHELLLESALNLSTSHQRSQSKSFTKLSFTRPFGRAGINFKNRRDSDFQNKALHPSLSSRNKSNRVNMSEKGVWDDMYRSNRKAETERLADKRRVDLMLRLLTVMDGISHLNLNGVLIVTTSQNPSSLDPALLRPGRFERFINVRLPNKEKRIELLKTETNRIGHTTPMPWEYLAARTTSMSGADITSAINHSAFRAILDNTGHTVATLEQGFDSLRTFASRTGMCFKRGKAQRSNRIRKTFSQTVCPAHRNSCLTLVENKNNFVKRESCVKQNFADLPLKPNKVLIDKERQIAFNKAGRVVVQALLMQHPKIAFLSLFDSFETNVSEADLVKNLSQNKKPAFLQTPVLQSSLNWTQADFSRRLINLYAGRAAEYLYLESDNVEHPGYKILESNLAHLEQLRATQLIQLMENCFRKVVQSKALLSHQICEVKDFKKVMFPFDAHMSHARRKRQQLLTKQSMLATSLFAKRLHQSYTAIRDLQLCKKVPVSFFVPKAQQKENFPRTFVRAVVKSKILPFNPKKEVWFVEKVYKKFEKQSYGSWYRLYLSKIDQNKRNREWLPPDHFSNQHAVLLNSHAKGLLTLQEHNKNRATTDLGLLEADLFYYNIVKNGFFTAFNCSNENRELLDLLADHLVRFKVLRLHEIVRICSFYLQS